MSYSLENFKMTYIDYDFDISLLDQNNDLVNSNTSYLDIKNNYLKQSLDNFEEFTQLLLKHIELSNNHVIRLDDNLTIHSYKFINTNNLDDTNIKLKVLLQNQKYIFDNFIHYISFINSTETISENVYYGDVNQPQTIKINNKKTLNFI